MCSENMNSLPYVREINLYKRVLVSEDDLQLPFRKAIMNGNVEHVNMILSVYESDLRFIERLLNCDNKFWLSSAILIGFGDRDISTLEQLYSEYRSVETDQCIDKEKCVVILLKRDNLTPVNVLCLSPKSEQGKMLTLRMMKSVYINEWLDINAKDNKRISLLCATAASGMFKASIRLLHLGADINILELASIAMAHGQLEYLDSLYKTFGFQMYDIFESNKYFKNIFGNDKWIMFEYVVHAIMAEKQLSWHQIVNYNRVIEDPWTDNNHNTIFHYAVRNNHHGIAEKYLQYSDCLTTTSQCCFLPINELKICASSLDLLMKMIENDPAQLELLSDPDEEQYGFGVFHKLLLISSLDDVVQFYQKYPVFKNLFFKCPNVGLHYISEMLSNRQYDLMKYVLENASGLLHSVLFEILTKLTYDDYDNVELFQYVMSIEDINFALLPISVRAEWLNHALGNKNYQISQVLLHTFEWDFNQIQVWRSSGILRSAVESLAHINIFNVLLQKRINFNTVCDHGQNLLHHSVKANNLYTTKKLLEFYVDMDKYDNHGKLPIHYATTLELFQLLNTWTIKSYVNVKTMNDGCSPLHLCMLATAGDTNLKLIQYILDNGGNINARNHEMKSPIFLVCDTERAKLLLERKPNLKLVDTNENTVIDHFLTVDGNQDVLQLLVGHNSLPIISKCRQHVDSILHAIASNCRHCTSELLELADLDVSVCDDNENSLLHVAIEIKNYDIIEKLIEKGVSIEHRNNQNETPLLLMCNCLDWIRYVDLIQLLKYTPDVNVRNGNNRSPILLASRSRNDKVEIIIELLLRGANLLDCENLEDDTAYDNLSQQQKKLFRFLI